MDITVKQKDAVNLIIECEKSIAKELSQYFTFYVPNYQYAPAYKKKIWDGQIRLFNVYGRTLYVGLLEYLQKFAIDRKYTIEIDSENLLSTQENTTSLDEFSDFIKSLNLNLKPHTHQLKASFHALNKKRTLLLSPTGSGKSLIIYILVKYCLKYLGAGEQILIVVPTVGLVNQLYADFVEYSNKTWDVDANVHKIFSGADKKSQKKIVVSTWQSLYNMPNDFFSTFSCVFGDECHLFKAKSLTGLMTKLSNAHFRVGTTGTLDGTLTHKLVIEGLFGPVYNVTSTKKLIDKKLLSDIDIKCLMLTYSDEIKNKMKRSEYQDEIKFLISNEKRNSFIENLTLNLTGNSLVLFNYVDLHGKVLYENIQKKEPNRQVFFIYGGTDADQREEIRNILNKEKNAILIASYGTCSTGINIPSRKTKDKKKTSVYDISDDLTYKSHVNHTMKHLDERIKIYTNEKFKYKITRINL